MRQYLTIIESQLLTEKADYLGMFADVIKLDPSYKPKIEEVINRAKTLLKKNDRIVWFARLFKMGHLLVLSARIAGDDPTKEQVVAAAAQRLLTTYIQKASAQGFHPDPAELRDDAHGLALNPYAVLRRLEHFFSLPIPAIQNYVFGFQDPETIWEVFGQAERKWQEETKDAFEDNDAKLIISFPDGFGWYNLGKAYCPKEAAAMGHCGNSPRSESADTILSLRKKIIHGEKTFFKPYLTFILDNRGELTEMKGKVNEKPDPHYHEHIKALLRLPMIKGITGGGFAPERNFDLSDLSDEDQEEIFAEKPNLRSLRFAYEQDGLTDAVWDKIEKKAYELNVPFERLLPESGLVVLKEYKNLREFLRGDNQDGIVLSLIDLYEGDDLDLVDLAVDVSDDDLIDIIEHMDEFTYRRVLKLVGAPYVAPNDAAFRRSLKKLVERMKGSERLMELIGDAANEATEIPPIMKELLRARLDDYISFGWSLVCSFAYDRPTGVGEDDRLEIVMNKDDFAKAIIYDEDEDDMEYYGEAHRLKQDGLDVSYDAMGERNHSKGDHCIDIAKRILGSSDAHDLFGSRAEPSLPANIFRLGTYESDGNYEDDALIKFFLPKMVRPNPGKIADKLAQII